MDRQPHFEIINDRIDRQIEAHLPNGVGNTNEIRFRQALDQVAQVAFEQGRQYALSNLLTVDDLAIMFNVTPRRIRARAQLLNDRYGTGWKVPGSRGTWLFTPEEIEIMRPGDPGRPTKED